MKKFSRILVLLVSMFIMLSIIACSNGNDEGSDTRKHLSSMAITDAKNLYITTGSDSNHAARAGTGGCKKLFKITENGYIEEVKYFSDDNSEITITTEPTFIQSVNAKFIIVGFGGFPTWPNTLYLVRKTDGVVFDMEKNTTFILKWTGLKTLMQYVLIKMIICIIVRKQEDLLKSVI